jgi:TrpR-related protein YerC/YecD
MKDLDLKEKELFNAILKLEDLEELRKFFSDLCTPAELQAMSDRWRVAQLLNEGLPYRTIYEKTGVSTATVTRVARCLEYGEGYRLVLQKTRKKTKNAYK